ncbi:MAG: barstar family protein [Saprospiraceae bacterium]
MESNNIHYYSFDGTRYVFIDGNTCDTIEKCYITIAQQLSIPDYFGYNLDALEEVLADLEWIEEEKVILIVLNADGILQNESEVKNDFLHVLRACDNARVEVIGCE